MNRILKIGLLFQLPNLLVGLILILGLLLNNVNWNWFGSNIGFIILGVVYGLFNIFSLIFICVGLIE